MADEARPGDPAPSPPDVASLLTVVLTTSPTPSAPSTDLVASVLASFATHCPALLGCAIIVVFDTYDRIGPQLRLKRGTVTAVEAGHYGTYKSNVRRLVQTEWARHAGLSQNAAKHEHLAVDYVEDGSAEFGSPFLRDNAVRFRVTHMHMRTPGGSSQNRSLPRISFVEPEARLGFGLGVRSALRLAATPYVWVQQHDWSLAADIPIAAMLDVMQASEGQASQGTTSPSNGDKDNGTLQPTPVAELGSVPVRYICLPSVRMLRYATSAHATEFPVLRAITDTYKTDFPTSLDGPLPLTPLFFWHDKTHIASRAHYLARIFPSRLALSRGDFIEDHVGQRARSQMKADAAAWKRWATWQYYPDDGNALCLRHLQGRTWRGEEQEQAMRAQYMERNRAEAEAEAAAEAVAAHKAHKAPPTQEAVQAQGADQEWVMDMPWME